MIAYKEWAVFVAFKDNKAPYQVFLLSLLLKTVSAKKLKINLNVVIYPLQQTANY